MNIANLQKMIKHLKTIDKDKFDMGTYREDASYNTIKCTTVGCIIGHCVILDNNIKEFIVIGGTIDFTGWSEKFTGINMVSYKWGYLFSSLWETVDNTIEGAIRRLEKVIKGFEPKPTDLFKINY